MHHSLILQSSAALQQEGLLIQVLTISHLSNASSMSPAPILTGFHPAMLTAPTCLPCFGNTYTHISSTRHILEPDTFHSSVCDPCTWRWPSCFPTRVVWKLGKPYLCAGCEVEDRGLLESGPKGYPLSLFWNCFNFSCQTEIHASIYFEQMKQPSPDFPPSMSIFAYCGRH